MKDVFRFRISKNKKGNLILYYFVVSLSVFFYLKIKMQYAYAYISVCFFKIEMHIKYPGLQYKKKINQSF